MNCGVKITHCFGFVNATDVLALLDGTFPEGQPIRELCGVCVFIIDVLEGVL
jgi:hypothetical protein